MLQSVDFRDKETGWRNFQCRYQFENGVERRGVFHEDIYMRGFLKNLYLRPSCAACTHKGIQRESDLTLADFWGVQNVLPELEEIDKGVSLVLARGEKGGALMDMISGSTFRRLVDAGAAIAGNPAALTSATIHPNADRFRASFGHEDLDALIERCLHLNFLQKVKRYVRRIFQ